MVVTPGKTHDAIAYGDFTAERVSDPRILLADRGCDSDAMPEISTRQSRMVQHSMTSAERQAKRREQLNHIRDALQASATSQASQS